MTYRLTQSAEVHIKQKQKVVEFARIQIANVQASHSRYPPLAFTFVTHSNEPPACSTQWCSKDGIAPLSNRVSSPASCFGRLDSAGQRQRCVVGIRSGALRNTFYSRLKRTGTGPNTEGLKRKKGFYVHKQSSQQFSTRTHRRSGSTNDLWIWWLVKIQWWRKAKPCRRRNLARLAL